jgi:sugar phosphate isomerase/epimerase
MQFACFAKSFQDLPLEQFCRRIYEIGFEGLDLTVRKGGKIEPSNVVAELPIAANTLHEAGLKFFFLTTDITDADASAERVLASAASLGVDRIKLGYYRYVPGGRILEQIDETRRRLQGVVALGRKHGVRPCVHIHSGSMIPSHGTMAYLLMKDFDPHELGAYVDPLHMTLEGGLGGWQQGLDILSPWISLCAVKNFRWEEGRRDKLGQQRWDHRVVPLADGIAPMPEFVSVLKKQGYDGIYSLHNEYKGRGSFKDLTTEECLTQAATDLKYFKTLF